MRAEFLTPAIAVLTLVSAAPAFAADPAPAPAAVPAPAAAAAPATAPAAAPAGVTFAATMTGANEVDAQGKGGQGDPDGTGTFSARIQKGQLCYKLSWSKVDDPTMAHIHKGAPGVSGPVLIGLSDVDTDEHCEDIDKDRLDAITSKPQNYYVNIHNGEFPNGALRGQLTKQ